LNNEDEQEKMEEQSREESVESKETRSARKNELIEQLRSELRKVNEQAKDCDDKYLRALAELDNQRKRSMREKEELQKYANERLILEILPVIDNFERAIDAGKQADNVAQMVDGVKMILKQLREILEKEGVAPFESLGEKFDPYKHEALLAIESKEHEPYTVLEEIQKGYTMKDRVIRPAKVTVSKKEEEKKEDDADGNEGKSNRD
jgi:molecular chaperone GrpE